jgi:hypothetical protein
VPRSPALARRTTDLGQRGSGTAEPGDLGQRSPSIWDSGGRRIGGFRRRQDELRRWGRVGLAGGGEIGDPVDLDEGDREWRRSRRVLSIEWEYGKGKTFRPAVAFSCNNVQTICPVVENDSLLSAKPREAPPVGAFSTLRENEVLRPKPKAKPTCLFRCPSFFLWKAPKSRNKQALRSGRVHPGLQYSTVPPR